MSCKVDKRSLCDGAKCNDIDAILGKAEEVFGLGCKKSTDLGLPQLEALILI